MKILWLYASMPEYDHNHWYHLDFARIINQQKDTQLAIYGYNLEKTQWSDLVLTPFDTQITAKDLQKIFKYDIIIMDNRYRFLRNPNKWDSINFFNNINNIPKIMIEGDFHLHKNEYLRQAWLKNNEINLILHRHCSNFLLGNKILPQIEQMWFPCSVDTNIFKSNPLVKREKLICSLLYGFARKIYPERNLMANKLKLENLVKTYECYLKNKNYIQCLQTYISHINGSSIYNINNAKMFEIMASGSILLTDENQNCGLQQLFPENSYCTYKKDGSDIIIQAKKIINDIDYRNYLIDNGLKCINQKHTHSIRANELINIIKDIL